MSQNDDPVLIREFNPLIRGEESFVYSTWLRALRDADPSGLPDDLWFDAHREHIASVLLNPKTTALVAAAADAPEEILGYVVAIPDEVLEWVTVKKRFRGMGLARRLLLAAKVSPDLPARWRTRDSGRLSNPWRPRELRTKR